MTTKLPNCSACGKQMELILNRLTWGYPMPATGQEPDQIDIVCLCGNGQCAKVLVTDLDPEHQQFFGKLRKQMEEKNDTS